MDKLKLKQLKHYADTDLQVLIHEGRIETVTGFFKENVIFDDTLSAPVAHVDIWEMQPLLLPMGWLTKPMTVKGYNDDNEFVPLEVLEKEAPYIRMYLCIDTNDNTILCIDRQDSDEEGIIGDVSITEINIVNNLLSLWHFDFQDLIGQGLARDKSEYAK